MQRGASPAGSDPFPAPATHAAPQSRSRQRRLAADHHPGPDGKRSHAVLLCALSEITNMHLLYSSYVHFDLPDLPED